MFHVFWRLPWTTRIWRHPQLHYLQTLRQEGGTHFKLQTSRKDILNLPVPQKQARGRGASGCTHLPSMEQQAGYHLYSVSDDQNAHCSDWRSTEFSHEQELWALNIMPWMVELIISQRLIMSIQLGLWLGNPRRTFLSRSKMPGQWNITSSWLVRLASQGSRQGPMEDIL